MLYLQMTILLQFLYLFVCCVLFICLMMIRLISCLIYTTVCTTNHILRQYKGVVVYTGKDLAKILSTYRRLYGYNDKSSMKEQKPILLWKLKSNFSNGFWHSTNCFVLYSISTWNCFHCVVNFCRPKDLFVFKTICFSYFTVFLWNWQNSLSYFYSTKNGVQIFFYE